ncbi:MAG: transposase [Ignavibacteriales bacterium]|nr:transposase [Ignavibacteriales bacterium]
MKFKDFPLSSEALQVLQKHIKTSITRTQTNGKIERFHRTISEECLRTNAFVDLEDAKNQLLSILHTTIENDLTVLFTILLLKICYWVV